MACAPRWWLFQAVPTHNPIALIPMNQATSLRPERPDDAPFLSQLYASTRADEMNLVAWDERQKEEFLRMQFALQTLHYRQYFPDAAFLIIELEAQPIGRLYVDRSPGQIVVMDIALVPEHRGSGIGGRLMQEILSEARDTQRPVRIHVERHNPALRFYERLQFRLIEDKGIHFYMEWVPEPATGE